MKKTTLTRKLVVTAMLSAIAFVLMLLEFPLPFLIPPFVKMDFSDLPALLGSFAFGPLCGVVIEYIKNLLHIIIKGTSSACVGELFNFLCGSFLCVSAGLIYHFNKTRKGAIIASIVGCFTMSVLSLPLNYFVVYPMYVNLYHMPLENIIAMYQDIMGPIAKAPTSNSLFNCLLVFNVPFTFFKGLFDAIICFLIYKPLSPILHKSSK